MFYSPAPQWSVQVALLLLFVAAGCESMVEDVDAFRRADAGVARIDAGEEPDAAGEIDAQACRPNCNGADCGSDGCGGSCGTCSEGTCNTVARECQVVCTPMCFGVECGDDGCDGSCGSCAGTDVCDAGTRQCVACVPRCDGTTCGDDGCGGACECGGSDTCNDATGRCESCTADCDGAECGDDGCGGSCGSCTGTDECDEDARECVCVPDCSGRECGDNGCGEPCGSCDEDGALCTGAGECCTPSCEDGQTCGSDGCGGSCGTCPDDRECYDCPLGASCEVETYICRCPFFDTLEYTLDASDLDWDLVRSVDIEFRHVGIDGTLGRRRGHIFTAGEPTYTFRVNGCVANLEVIERHYFFSDFRECEADPETVTEATITVPMASRDAAGTCTIPPL